MRTLVVYESMFGNTKAIAEAVAGTLRQHGTVEVSEVASAPDEIGPDVDLVVIAGPTHAFGMTRPSTRQDAAQRNASPLVSSGRGIREWIDTLRAPAGVRFATLDTKVSRPRLPGSAAKSAAKRCTAMGWVEVARPATFYVDGVCGPLLDGELERAATWASTLMTVGPSALAT